MSSLTVPDNWNCTSDNLSKIMTDGKDEDDVNWCTGFWNELVREDPPRYIFIDLSC